MFAQKVLFHQMGGGGLRLGGHLPGQRLVAQVKPVKFAECNCGSAGICIMFQSF